MANAKPAGWLARVATMGAQPFLRELDKQRALMLVRFQAPQWVKRKLPPYLSMSVLPPKADITEKRRHVGLVPQADIGSFYSMTSSARASSAGGTVMPSDFAILRLIVNSNLVGCTTGKSAGFAPPRIRPT
jgi:hypothetical protein